MHGPIRDHLEDLLTDRTNKGLLADRGEQAIAGHLAACGECSSELAAMKEHSALFSALRVSEMDPAAGFYARVLQRIEDSEFGSFWAFFVDSRFSRRLAIASLTIAVALGTYVISEETRERPQMFANTIAFNGTFHPPVTGDQAQQRDAVLVNFASDFVPVSQGQIQ